MTSLSVDDALSLLSHLLEQRRSKLKGVVGLAVAAHGRFLIDPSGDNVVREGWDENVAAGVLLNKATLIDLVLGRFKPDEMTREQLFLWTGDAKSLQGLADALGASPSSPWQSRLTT